MMPPRRTAARNLSLGAIHAPSVDTTATKHESPVGFVAANCTRRDARKWSSCRSDMVDKPRNTATPHPARTMRTSAPIPIRFIFMVSLGLLRQHAATLVLRLPLSGVFTALPGDGTRHFWVRGASVLLLCREDRSRRGIPITAGCCSNQSF